MSNYITIRKEVISKIPLNRKLSQEELRLIEDKSIYELYGTIDSPIDWENEIESDCDNLEIQIYHNGQRVN